ncbi:hypothetical protein C8F04DRAFT_1049845 [Mycena alexandri]|uniref:Uncharacterized protein n=1 Tax=Mycena alexandri TaxID=1745969 RepID=A0AAD6S746_9AGAR|nr:hypothetical protein C8F04DRAFT_1049845 [Mycena alexandri]
MSETKDQAARWEPLALENKPSWVLPSPFEAYAPGLYYGSDWGPQPVTLSEMGMYELSWTLRSKPEWQRKAADAEIRGKWRAEAVEQLEAADAAEGKTLEECLMTPKMVDYVLAELDDYVAIANNERGIERACFEAIWYSDRLVSDDLTQRFKRAAKALEDVADAEKDWHPGSNGQVLDLVHPSLYCVVYGRTHAYLPEKPRTAANFLPVCEPEINQNEWTSPNFCWLPSDFIIDSNGTATLASDYINNLHPVQHAPLYRVIEEVLTGFVPMFERVLGDSNREGGRKPFAESGRLEKIECIWGPHGKPQPEEDPGSDDDEDEFYEKFYDSVDKIIPEANEYAGQLQEAFKPVNLRGQMVQCIIKLANIHLTPEKPDYAGGSWHVEGMTNENIVASGIFYYDEENISESKLSFRVPIAEPHYHMQDDSECMTVLYGMDRDEDLVQDIGAVVTKAGRALSWPNLFQHCVSDFKLADPTKPGHRKILAIFLVDPTKDRIVSATDVPPQQASWAAEAFTDACDAPTSVLGELPQELRDLVKANFPETVMSLKEAEEYRLKLMKERTAFVDNHTEKVYRKTFNMCEH